MVAGLVAYLVPLRLFRLICAACCFCGWKAAKVLASPIRFDRRRKGAGTLLIDAYVPCLRANGTDVEVVLSDSYHPQVCNAVIRPASVDMVDASGRQFAVHIEPCEPVREVVAPVDAYLAVAFCIRSASSGPGAQPRATVNKPGEFPGLLVVGKHGGELFVCYVHLIYSVTHPPSSSHAVAIIEAGQWLAGDLLQQPCRSYTRPAASMMVLVSPRCHTGRNALLLAPTNRLCPAGLQYWVLMLANRVLPLLGDGPGAWPGRWLRDIWRCDEPANRAPRQLFEFRARFSDGFDYLRLTRVFAGKLHADNPVRSVAVVVGGCIVQLAVVKHFVDVFKLCQLFIWHAKDQLCAH